MGEAGLRDELALLLLYVLGESAYVRIRYDGRPRIIEDLTTGILDVLLYEIDENI